MTTTMRGCVIASIALSVVAQTMWIGFSMIAPRFMMLAWSLSRRRSRKRYLSRVSSGYSCSPNTGIGSSAAGPSTSISVT